MCDLAYVHLAGEFNRQADTVRLGLVVAAAMGRKGIELSDVAADRAKLDEMLAAPLPRRYADDRRTFVLRQALGLPRAG